MFGYTPDELHGTYMIELVHPEDRGRTLQTSWQVMSGDAKIGYRNRYVRSADVARSLGEPPRPGADTTLQRCVICETEYEGPDMAHCPAYQGRICSLCCTLDARCGDLCKPHASLSAQWSGAPGRWCGRNPA